VQQKLIQRYDSGACRPGDNPAARKKHWTQGEYGWVVAASLLGFATNYLMGGSVSPLIPLEKLSRLP
jgi:hypothetical protein